MAIPQYFFGLSLGCEFWEQVIFAREYLYSELKTLYLRAFSYLIAKELKLSTFKSDMHPELCEEISF